MATSEQLDIIVIAHNHLELTIQCVAALFRHTVNPFHLIVVDDSSDLTPSYFKSFSAEHSNVTFLHSAVPYKNGNQAISHALEHCRTPYVASVVNSLTVEPEWDVAGLQLMKATPQVGVIGFKCLSKATGVIESAGLVTSPDGSTILDIGVGQASHRFSKVYECEAVQWAFVLIRILAVRGNLNGNLPHGFRGWEDFDNCFLLRELGWKILYCGLGVGYHQSLSTRGMREELTEDETRKVITQNQENREVWAKRWGYWEDYHKLNPQQNELFPKISSRPRLKMERA